MWKTDGQPIGKPFSGFENDSVSSIAFSPNHTSIIVGDHNGRIRLLDLKGNQLWQNSDRAQPSSAVAFSADGKLIISAESENSRLWDLEGKPIGQSIESYQTGEILGLQDLV